MLGVLAPRSRNLLRLALVFAAMVMSVSVNKAAAQAVWEDYQGQQNILGSSNQDKPGPNYNNNSGGSNLNNLRTISADSSNTTRAGSSATIDYAAASPALCDINADPAGTGAACQADAMGRVVYALVKFPTAGNYTFAVAHDDEVDLDLSSDYTNTSYRTAAYNLPVASASGYTGADTNFEALGTVNAPAANSCVLLRLYWNNAGGLTFLRLQWTKPSSAVEIVPAGQLFDPGAGSSAAGCVGSITAAGTSITVNKVVGATGRAAAADQFTVALVDNGTGNIAASATTSGSATGQQASTGATIVSVGTVYRLTDAMAAGSGYALGAYIPTIACTRNGVGFTPGGAAPTWTTSTSGANEQILCTITNSRAAATVQLRKTWVGAVINNAVTLPATTGFATNTTNFASVANTANETDAGVATSVLVGNVGTLGAETFTTGTASSYASALTCTGGTLSGSNAQAANTLTIQAADAGGTLVCTYTNSYRPPLVVTKTSFPVYDPVNITTNPKFLPGGAMNYIVSVTNPGPTLNANSLVITDPRPANLRMFVGDLFGGGSGPVIFSDGAPSSSLTYTYSGLASTADDVDFSNDNGATWTYVPVPDGQNYDSAVTNVRIRPKGSMASGGAMQVRFQFALN